MTVYLDQLEGGGGARYTGDGYEFRRTAKVDGLTGDADARAVAAVAALVADSRCGDIGAAHPDQSGSVLHEMAVTHLSPAVAEVTLTYRPHNSAAQSVEVGTTLQPVNTNKDSDGNLMTVQWGKKQAGEVSVLRPHSTLRVHRREALSPGHVSREYVGTVNELNGFALAGGQQAARTWLCTSIVGRSSDSGQTYWTDYAFEYNADTWDIEVAYTDPKTGKIPDQVITSSAELQALAIKTFQVYAENNFDGLGL